MADILNKLLFFIYYHIFPTLPIISPVHEVGFFTVCVCRWKLPFNNICPNKEWNALWNNPQQWGKYLCTYLYFWVKYCNVFELFKNAFIYYKRSWCKKHRQEVSFSLACEIKRNIFGYFLPIFKANANRKLFVRERATSFTVWRCLSSLCSKFTKIIQIHLTLSLTAICHTARGLIGPSKKDDIFAVQR